MTAWTRERPTTAGWYWWRSDGGSFTVVVWVDGRLCVGPYQKPMEEWTDQLGGEWQAVKEPEA